MTDKDYSNMLEFVMEGNGWIANNENAQELMEQTSPGEVQMFKEVTGRDIKRLKCYFSLLNYIWNYLPDKFKAKVPCDKFYLWLKHIRGEWEVIFEFGDNTKLIEYTSISFGKMSEFEFREYIKQQMPFIYSDVIGRMYEDEECDAIIENIENDYSSFFATL